MLNNSRVLLGNGFIEEDLSLEGNVNVTETAETTSSAVEVDAVKETETETTQKVPKNKSIGKKGLIYISSLPKHMNVTRIRELLGQYGKIDRVYLQPQKLPGNQKMKKKRLIRHFSEGWVEFDKKKVAKRVAALLNNTQISTRKKSQFYDCLWNMKYLSGLKWMHLTERMHYEQQVYKQRLRTEVSQARKEASFFQANLDKSESLKKNKIKRKPKESN